MIGNSYAVDDSGWSLLEVGELDRASFTLRVQGYQVANQAGECVGDLFASRDDAYAFARQQAKIIDK